MSRCVLISEVVLYTKAAFGTPESVLIVEVSLFRSIEMSLFHSIEVYSVLTMINIL